MGEGIKIKYDIFLNMKKLKKLQVSVTYNVELFDLEVSDEIFDQLEEVTEINFDDDIYPELAEFLHGKVNEYESSYGFYSIDFFEKDLNVKEECKRYILIENDIYSPNGDLYLNFENTVSNIDKQAILGILNDSLC